MDIMASAIHLQTYLAGRWHDAAVVTFAADDLGHRGATTLDYEIDYCLALDPEMTGLLSGIQALSVAFPISMEWKKQPHWPAFLLDMLPQGHARVKLAEVLQVNPETDACELPLLLRAGGSPIGNLRVREAWQHEQERVVNLHHPGLTMDEIVSLDERFLTLAAEFAALASGSSGVQGAWPKVLLTQGIDGNWYPDPMVADQNATDHVIVKWVGDKQPSTQLILAAEAPYLELAREFGLRCGRNLIHRDKVLVMPRFDRRVEDRQVIRYGQESMVAAAGVASFGHDAAHEDYLAVIRRVCSDPAAEVTEYVLRDLLNLAMGNPDNHGRNTSLQKCPDGTVQLTPLYDFCPMRLDPTGVRRSTTWACMKKPNERNRDLDPDWRIVCTVAADGAMDPAALRAAVASKADLLARFPERARAMGVAPEVVDRAMGRCQELARAISGIADGTDHAPA
jgi:serine/threonine-protein kinase HipA